MKNLASAWLIFTTLLACQTSNSKVETLPISDQYLIVLGIAQDAGYPQIGCERACCQLVWDEKEAVQYVVSLGLVDQKNQQKWLFEATPNIKEQLQLLNQEQPSPDMLPNGIFITHAHMGHYTGLMQLGREAIGAKALPVYAMPRMQTYLSQNGPWSQLVELQNIALQPLSENTTVTINSNLKVIPFKVPHRDEFSETVGYKIIGNNKSALFIPDIDKWQKWERNIQSEIEQVDYALLDATFYENGELPNRDMSEIPHPFVEETIDLLQDLPLEEKNKVIFIHFNHTNPLVRNSEERSKIERLGFRVARQGMKLDL